MFSRVRNIITAGAVVSGLVLSAPQPLLAELYGYGYGYGDTIQAVIDDVRYQGSSNNNYQAFLLAEYEDSNLRQVNDYTLQIYNSAGLKLISEISLVNDANYPHSMLFQFEDIDEQSTVIGMTADKNGNGVNDIELRYFFHDTSGTLTGDDIHEVSVIFDGATGDTIAEDFPYPGEQTVVAASVQLSESKIRASRLGGSTVSFKETVNNNLNKKQVVQISSVIEKPDGTYAAGPSKVYKLRGHRSATKKRTLKLPSHFPEGKYRMIVTISSYNQPSYFKVLEFSK